MSTALSDGQSTESRTSIGVDVGTSGVRAIAIDESGAILASSARPLPAPRRADDRVEQDPALWWTVVVETLQALSPALGNAPATLAVDGTSATLLLTDFALKPLGPALLYSDGRARSEAEAIARVATPDTGAIGPTASLAKLLWLHRSGLMPANALVLHQADWISAKLLGKFVATDYNNALKLGFDARGLEWPEWLGDLGLGRRWLPEVVAPGTELGVIAPALASQIGLPQSTTVVAPTTDSTAAFLAAGATEPGEAVTSLGSSLVVKIVAGHPIYDRARGVYSHRLGRRWLVGGGSNTGGAALLRHFRSDEIESLSASIDPKEPFDLDYYPLLSRGERFPVCDPDLEPRWDPKPPTQARFLHALLEAIARIEATGYALLHELGAPKLLRVLSTGGGAGNEVWTQIRERHLGVPVRRAKQIDAAYGAALVARGDVQRVYEHDTPPG